MTKLVTASLGLIAQSFHSGTVPGLFRVTLLSAEGAVVETQESAEPKVTFKTAEPGPFSAFAVRLDAAGLVIGSGAGSEDSTETVKIDVPDSVTVSVA